jgi:hypothetical protein
MSTFQSVVWRVTWVTGRGRQRWNWVSVGTQPHLADILVRLIPTLSWESMLNGIVQWMGLNSDEKLLTIACPVESRLEPNSFLWKKCSNPKVVTPELSGVVYQTEETWEKWGINACFS